MLKKLALATAAVGLLMSTASADYYIVGEGDKEVQGRRNTSDRNYLDPDWAGGVQNTGRC